MDTKDAGRKGGLKKWAKVKGKRARSEIMKQVRRGEKLSKPSEHRNFHSTKALHSTGTKAMEPALTGRS
ncbi:MAG TPA: hypothetical protein VIX59_09745 [Candidatus Binataceae bacterium]